MVCVQIMAHFCITVCMIARINVCLRPSTGEVFDYLVAHGRMKEREARVKFRQVDAQTTPILLHLLLYSLSVV